MLVLILTLLLVAAPVVAADEVALAEPVVIEQAVLAERVERYVEPYLAIGHLSGTVLLARDGEVVYEDSFGMADHEQEVANTPRTRFGVASVNKPMTIVILARLIEEGKLSLEDRLSKYLPNFPRGGEITVRHLLEHSAGIPHRVTGPLDEVRQQTPASMALLAAGKELVFEPGSDSVYSSAGFSVIARVLELAGGKAYAELLEEHVLRPAGINDTFDVGSRAILPRRAASYVFDIDGLLNAPPGDVSYLVGAGSVYSTPRDLLAMQRALLGGKLGGKAKELLVGESGDLSWNGQGNGYRAFIDFDAASGITLAVTSNLTSGALDRIRRDLPKIAAGEAIPTPAPLDARPAAVDSKVLASYQGAYRLRPGRNLELRVVDGRVRMNDWLLIPTSKTTLFSPQDYATIEVVLDEDGTPQRLDWTTGDTTYPLPRVGELAEE